MRTARYAGSWYEAEPCLLEERLDNFLKKAASTSVANLPQASSILALVVPHAGYFFSGQAAAHAYNVVKQKKVKRIFLLGPGHYVAFHGVALSRATFFETPLGNLSLDQEAVAPLKQHPLFVENVEAHCLEHSLEMQLPLIKKVFGNVKLVPLIVGSLQDETEIREVAAVLKPLLSEGDLIVVSSDFTHYGPRFQYEPFQKNISENIKKLDLTAYHFLETLDLNGFLKFHQETSVTICGFYPLGVLLALLPRTAQASLLNYYTSQDVIATDPEHSVSYLAIAFSTGENN